ncbi:AN1-type zinc finger protein 6-like isoform X2 [Centruroides sculpturatus]|nr:AN1-type zinc finger protein 6-like isoform X2 [Centruroides sculpturatus]
MLNTASPTVHSVASSSQETNKFENLNSPGSQTEAAAAASPTNTTTEEIGQESANQTNGTEPKEQKKKNRCNVCRKKVGLTENVDLEESWVKTSVDSAAKYVYFLVYYNKV